MEMYESALVLFRAEKDHLGEANTLIDQGEILLFQDQYAHAMERLEAALQLYREVGDRLGEANALDAMG